MVMALGCWAGWASRLSRDGQLGLGFLLSGLGQGRVHMAIAPKPAILEQDHQGTRPRRWSREVGIDGDLAARPSGVPSSEAFLGVESPISLPWYLRVMGHLGLGVRLEGGWALLGFGSLLGFGPLLGL